MGIEKRKSRRTDVNVYISLRQLDDKYVTGYSGISSMKEKPSPMEDDEITVMKNVANQIGIELNVGDTVIVEGHDLYDGQQLRVVSIDPQNEKIELEVNSLLGDDTASELFDFDQIRKTK